MGPTNIYIFVDILNIFWELKIEILSGIFASLAVYSYFYNVRKERKESVAYIKHRIKEMKKVRNDIKQSTMSVEDRISQLFDLVRRLEKGFEKFEISLTRRLDKSDKDAEDLEKRVFEIEKNNAVTRREIAFYVTIFLYISYQVLEKLKIF